MTHLTTRLAVRALVALIVVAAIVGRVWL